MLIAIKEYCMFKMKLKTKERDLRGIYFIFGENIFKIVGHHLNGYLDFAYVNHEEDTEILMHNRKATSFLENIKVGTYKYLREDDNRISEDLRRVKIN